MEKLKAEISRLADIELETAVEKWGLNHSDHESAGVLLEEIEEAKDELINVEIHYKQLRAAIKKNDTTNKRRSLYNGIYNAAVNLAAEAAQIAAMARKGILSNIEIYEKGGGDL